MVTPAELEELALALPETTVRPSYHATPAYRVRDKIFARLREETAAEIDPATGQPYGDVVVVHVADLDAKEELLAAEPRIYFATPHFDGYASLLIRLAEIDRDELAEALAQSWLVRAPKRLAAAWRAEHEQPRA